MTEEQKNTYHIDYKDADKLSAYLNPHARMLNRRKSGLSARQQRDLARSVKRARYMALVPYVSK